MTTVPEVVLAKEAGLSYASVAMVTDYDCWKEHEEAVDVQAVLKVLAANVDNVRRLFVQVVKLMGQQDWTKTIEQNQVLYV
jgi:5'-methylthioadenosine phosphorylase